MFARQARRNYVPIALALIAFFYLLNIFWSDESSLVVTKSPARTCTSKENVVFLKTHKCASSTVQRIFLKYGYLNGKVFLLPSSGNYFGHPRPFHRSMVPSSPAFDHKFNILAHHTRFNAKEIESVMPEDTAFVTILRDPERVFESILGYWKLDKLYGITPKSGNSSKLLRKLRYHRYAGKIGSNQMLFDLGFDANKLNRDRLMRILKYLDHKFHLVMIAEKFRESLILLSELLCWTLNDVIAFRVSESGGRYLSMLIYWLMN